jgi:hypothetical protein
LTQSLESFIALGCGSDERILFIPFPIFNSWLSDIHTTEVEGRQYWHIEIHLINQKLVLSRRKGVKTIDLMGYLIP